MTAQERNFTIAIMCGFFLLIVFILSFLAFVLIAHERTVQDCIDSTHVWESGACISTG